MNTLTLHNATSAHVTVHEFATSSSVPTRTVQLQPNETNAVLPLLHTCSTPSLRASVLCTTGTLMSNVITGQCGDCVQVSWISGNRLTLGYCNGGSADLGAAPVVRDPYGNNPCALGGGNLGAAINNAASTPFITPAYVSQGPASASYDTLTISPLSYTMPGNTGAINYGLGATPASQVSDAWLQSAAYPINGLPNQFATPTQQVGGIFTGAPVSNPYASMYPTGQSSFSTDTSGFNPGFSGGLQGAVMFASGSSTCPTGTCGLGGGGGGGGLVGVGPSPAGNNFCPGQAGGLRCRQGTGQLQTGQCAHLAQTRNNTNNCFYS